MVRNYFKVAIRNLWRQKGFAFINVFGLSVGLACCILIFLYVKEEITFDTFHNKSERIYRAWVLEDYGDGKVFFNTVTPGVLAPTLSSHYNEISKVTRFSNRGGLIRKDGQMFNELIWQAGPEFFDIFDFPVLSGSTEKSLEELNSIVITEKAARKYFGSDPAVGKVMEIQMGAEFQNFFVKAVLSDIPANSSLQFDYLISDLHYKTLYNPRTVDSWTNVICETYILLDENNHAEALADKFPNLINEILPDFDQGTYSIGLQPITDIHLNPDMPVGYAPVSDPKYSYILSAIAVLILVVAAVNFMTLSLGQSMVRAKEVGVRKVAGAQRRQLIFQFLAEASLVTLISLGMGVLLSILGLPLFNDLAGKTLALNISGTTILFFGMLAGLITFFAGSYPAFILSGFRPIMVLKNDVKVGGGKQTLRKLLVIVQFVFSIFLISSTLIMRSQINFLRNKDLGFKKEQVLVVPLNISAGRYSAVVESGMQASKPFRNELMKLPEVVKVGVASHIMGTGGWTGVGYTDSEGNFRNFDMNSIDEDYIPALQIEVKHGRNFDVNIPSDIRRGIIINEAFAKEYAWEDPLIEKIPGNDFPDHEIIGVVKDFNYASLHGQVTPLVMVMDPGIILKGISDIGIGTSIAPKLMISMSSDNLSESVEKIKAVWNKLSPGEEFNFSFVDQTLDAQYENDRHLEQVVTSASILAILIGSLGLLGLASLNMTARVKEISMRKILGASNQTLLTLLAWDFLIMIAIALVLAVPVTYFAMSNWLNGFSYRVSITPVFFLAAGGISLLVAMLTISYHAVKTTMTNPANNLRHE
jgi:putative ABC transport system permease protein